MPELFVVYDVVHKLSGSSQTLTKKNVIIASIIFTLVGTTWKILDIKKANRKAEIAQLPLRERGMALLEFEGCTSCHQPGNN